MFYIMNPDGSVRKAKDTEEWAKSYEETRNRHIQDYINETTFQVSTIFLGVAVDLDEAREPQMFETMIFETTVFDGSESVYEERYCTIEEARAGHARIVQNILEGREYNSGRPDED